MQINHTTPTEIISIFECLTSPAVSNISRLVAVVGSKERAINGARALALASGKTHFVQIEILRESTRHIWITAQDAAAAIKSANKASSMVSPAIPPSNNPAVQAADNFIANRRQHQAIAAGTNEQPMPGWFSRLKSRTPQPGYVCYTGDESACKEACKFWPGARAKRNGSGDCWLLVVPLSAIHGNQPAAIPTVAA